MLVYFVFVLGIGFALKRYMRTSNDFFLAGRSIPAWVCGLAFISANLGAQEVIGMGASGAKYGIITSHFYWIGAIPAMIFVGIFMMPFYYGSKARSVPEYLRLRFDEKTRAVNAFSFAIMTVLSSGISMYAMALLIQTLGLLHGIVPDAYIFHVSVFLSAIIVLGYIFLGGLTSAIYNEVTPVLPDRRRLRSSGLDRPAQRRRLAGNQAHSSGQHDPLLAGYGPRQHQHPRRRMGGPRHGPGFRPLLRLLVH